MKYIKAISPRQVHELRGIDRPGWYQDMDRSWMCVDNGISVCSRLVSYKFDNKTYKVEHVSLSRDILLHDSTVISWAERMDAKNSLFGSDKFAIEIYPKTDNLIDICDVYHLWVFEKGIRDIFGISTKPLGRYDDRLIATPYGIVEQWILPITNSFDTGWNDKWELKNESIGPDRVAIEILPAKSSTLYMDNRVHLFAFDPSFDIPFGIHPKEYEATTCINRGYPRFTEAEMMELDNYLHKND